MPLNKEKNKFTTPWGTIFNVKQDPIQAEVIDETPPEISDEIITNVPTPKIATKAEPVVFWDETTWGTKEESTSLLSWLDRESIISRTNKWWQDAKNLWKEIQNRRNIEKITWVKDDLLAWIWFSTIKDDEIQKEGVFSNEVSLDFADRVLSWEFEKLWLAPNQQFNDERLTEFLDSQWLNEQQIKQVISARDARLKEKRIKWAGKTRVEEKEAILRQELATKTERINKQVEARQKLLQRQRSLRGIWRSSSTEEVLLEVQEEWAKLISAAQRANDLELSLFKAQSENLDSEVIASIQEGLSKANQNLQKQINLELDEMNKLVAAWELDNDLAFESLMSSLEIAWTDTWWVNKFTSESTWILSDKFGNPILDAEWNQIPVWWKSTSDIATISNYADWLINWKIPFWSIPTELRDNVVNSWAAKLNNSIKLSWTQIADAEFLADELFGNNKESSVNAIKALMQQGLSNKEIIERWRDVWFSEEYSWSIRDWLNQATLSLWEEKSWRTASIMNRLLSEWKNSQAIDLLLGSAAEGATAQQKDKITWLWELTWNLTSIRSELNKLSQSEIDWIEWEEVDTWKITQAWEKIFNLVWKSSDPRITRIATQMWIAIQAYRQSRSWAAFSESEAKEYAALFPGIWKDFELNSELIKWVLNTAEIATNNFYRGKIWVTNFDNIFSNGVMNTLHPWQWFTWGANIIDFTNISDDLSDEEIINQINKWNVGTFDINSDNSLDTFLDATEENNFNPFSLDNFKEQNQSVQDFNKPDTTGWTNEIWQKIQQDIDRIAQWTSVNANDILAIAGNRNVNPAILAAFLRNDSTYWSKWLGSKNNNPWNVWQFDRLWTEWVEWFKTIQEWIDAAASNLEKRTLAFKQLFPNREPTAFELAKWIANWKKFFWPYMTEKQWAKRVQDIVNQLTS